MHEWQQAPLWEERLPETATVPQVPILDHDDVLFTALLLLCYDYHAMYALMLCVV